MKHLRRSLPGALLLSTLATLGARSAHGDPPPPRADESERWIGLRVSDPALRLRAVADTKGPLNEVADAIPFLTMLNEEGTPVGAAARERLQELAGECVNPLLDALQAARPGRTAGAFGALSALGTAITPVDLAVAAGALGPVNPPDRREAALFIALPAGTPSEASIARRNSSLRLASLLLQDPDAQVRRAAAGALAIVGLEALRAYDRHERVRLTQGQRERVVELMAHGSADIAVAAAGLAARFGDASEPVLTAIVKLLDKPDRRDGAALALAAFGDAAASTADALAQHESFATWFALARIGRPVNLLEMLAGTHRSRRRLALSVALATGLHAPEVARALLPELEEELQDGDAPKVEAALRRIAVFGTAGSPALPALEAFVVRAGGDPALKDLVVAAALSIDPLAAWARPRVDALLAPLPGASAPSSGLARRHALAALFQHELVPAGLLPKLLDAPTLTGGTLGNDAADTVGVRLNYYLREHRDAPGPYVAPLLELLASESGGKAPTLRDFAKDYPRIEVDLEVRRATLLTLQMIVPFTVVSPVVERLLGAPDPWIRHWAARTLRAHR